MLRALFDYPRSGDSSEDAPFLNRRESADRVAKRRQKTVELPEKADRFRKISEE